MAAAIAFNAVLISASTASLSLLLSKIVAAASAAESTAFCNRVLFTTIWLISTANAETAKKTNKAAVIMTTTKPCCFLGLCDTRYNM